MPLKINSTMAPKPYHAAQNFRQAPTNLVQIGKRTFDYYVTSLKKSFNRLKVLQ